MTDTDALLLAAAAAKPATVPVGGEDTSRRMRGTDTIQAHEARAWTSVGDVD